MADLQNIAPQDSYQALLTLETINISSTFKRIQDGAGTDTALGLSTEGVKSYAKVFIDTVEENATEFTALLIDPSGEVVRRELGASAFDASGTPTSRTLTIQGTEDQLNVSVPNSQTLEADRTWTISLPTLVNFPGAIDVSTNAEISGTITNPGIQDSSSATYAVLVDATSTNVFVRRELDVLAFGGGVPETRTITFAGTANEITVDPTTPQDLTANRTVTIALPDDVTIGQDLTVTRYLEVGQVDENLNELTGLLYEASSNRVVRREFSSYAFSGGIPATRTITMNGTANQVLVDTSVNGTPKALSSDLSFTVSLPDDVTLVDDLTVGGTVYILDVVGDVTVTKALFLMPSGEVVYRTLGDAAFQDASAFIDTSSTAQIINGSANIDVDITTAQIVSDNPVWNIDLADNVDIVGTLDVTLGTNLDNTLDVSGTTSLHSVASDTNELSVLLINANNEVVQNELDAAAFNAGLYDTGWVNIPDYNGSIGWYNTTSQPDRPQYRVIGRTVLLKGELLIPLADAAGNVIGNYDNQFDASSTDVATTGTGYNIFGDKNISLPLFWDNAILKPDTEIRFYNRHGLRVVTDGTSGSSYRIPMNSVVNFLVQPGNNRFVIQALRDAETGTGTPFSSFWLRNDIRRMQCTIAEAGDVVANFGTGLSATAAGSVSGYQYKTSYDPTTTGPADGLNMFKMTPYITGTITTKYPVSVDASDGTFLGGFRIRLDDCYFTLSTSYTLKQIHDLL